MKTKIFTLLITSLMSLSIVSGQTKSILDFKTPLPGINPIDAFGSKQFIYLLTQLGGESNKGTFSKLSYDGAGFTLINSFDSASGCPISIIGNDSIIFGTTINGKLFKYSIKNSSFEFINVLPEEVNVSANLKYITDSVIWGYSNANAKGNIFKINPDGSNYRVVYELSSDVNGVNPTDICIYNSSIFISCLNGGLYPFTAYDSSLNSSGALIKVGINGDNFTKLFDCRDSIGTHPISLIAYKDYIYGMFNSAGQDSRGKLFRMNKDGLDFKIISDLEGVGRGELFVRNDTLFGITSNNLFYYDLKSFKYKKCVEFNMSIGTDAVVGPIFYNNNVTVCTQQRANEFNGSVLNMDYLNDNFNSIDYKIKVYDTIHVTVYDTIHVTVNDTIRITIYDTISNCSNNITDTKKGEMSVYPIPTKDFINVKLVNMYEANTLLTIYDLSGKPVIIQKFNNELERIDLINLNKGIYIGIIANSRLNERFKIIKE